MAHRIELGPWFPLVVLVLSATAWMGKIGAHGPGSEGSPTTGSLCAGGAALPLAEPAPLRRLSRLQYVKSLSDVIQDWAPSVASQILTTPAVTSALATLPEDSRVTGNGDRRGGFRRLDQDYAQDRVDAQFAIAQAVAAELTSSPARIAALLGSCASDADTTNDAACLDTFLRRGGRVVNRRPLDEDDVTFYQSVYAAKGIDAAGLADVVATMLMSPYFTFQVEHGDVAVDASQNLYALDAQELANHLNGTPRWDALRGSFTPTGDTRENMIDEVTRLASYYATKPDGTFSDLFTTRKSFATTDDVAQIYGVAKWAGTGEPPDIADPDRVGLITHAALVATGAALTRPIIKGVVLRSV